MAATTSIVADWVRAVGRERVDVFPLVPPNADPHTFQPGARDIARVSDAGLVLSVGLSLEAGWMNELLQNAARDPDAIVALGEHVDPLDFTEILDEHATRHESPHAEGEYGHESEGHQEHSQEQHGQAEEGVTDAHAHGQLDPHFWFDPLRVKRAVDAIASQLTAIDPDGGEFYRDNAAAYNRELDALHAWIQGEVAKLPEERRLLVTSHDSFQYFARRYDFEIVGAVIPDVTTGSEPTAQELSALVETIEHEGAPAVFAEKSHSSRLAQRIAEETGATLIGGLYTGSLGPEDEAGTYLDLMRYNVKTIVEALE